MRVEALVAGTAIFAACFVIALPADAQDKPGATPPRTPVPPTKSDTTEQAADKVSAAVAAKADAALKSLAAKDDPDPWLVADELCARLQFDAADAFARAAPRTAVNSLPACVAVQKAAPVDPSVRAAVATGNVAFAARKGAEALACVDGVTCGVNCVQAVRLQGLRALALRLVGRMEESDAEFARALAAAESLGWQARVGDLLHEVSAGARRRGEGRIALEVARRRMALEESLGRRMKVASCLADVGLLAMESSNLEEALRCFELALKTQEEFGSAAVAWTVSAIGDVHRRRAELPEALACYQRSLKLTTDAGDRAAAAWATWSVGEIHRLRGAWAEAITSFEVALKVQETLGDRGAAATALSSLGSVHLLRGEYAQALDCCERSLKTLEELGVRRDAASTLAQIGDIHRLLDDYPKALEVYGRAVAKQDAMGDRAGAARTTTSIGDAHRMRGEYAKALACYERALNVQDELKDSAAAAVTLRSMGEAQGLRGDYPAALVCLERALKTQEARGDRCSSATILLSMGDLHRVLGERVKALDFLQRALSAKELTGDLRGTASTLLSMGDLHRESGDHVRALELLERALGIQEQIGDRHGAAETLATIGKVHRSKDECPAALDCLERAMRTQEELGDRRGAAARLASIGKLHVQMGDRTKALACFERALEAQEELGDRAGAAGSLWDRGSSLAALNRTEEAISFFRRAAAASGGLGAGLSVNEGATSRETWVGLHSEGLAAAVRLARVDDACFFLESGRAAEMQEALKLRDALLDSALPQTLREAEAAARSHEAAAARTLRSVLADQTASLRSARAARADLDAARAASEDVIGRIQREAKAIAGLIYPRADDAGTLRSRLRPSETLVLYGEARGDLVALVATTGDARIVVCAKTAAVEAAVAALQSADATQSAEAAAALRGLLVDPLQIPTTTTRLLISPQGVLAYVPFALLTPEHEIVCIPSGTTYGALADDAGKRGEGVLALGDPDYARKSVPQSEAVALRGGGAPLGPLPATGFEAKAVGDVVLLGIAATEQGLRDALARKRRWRAVHLACHGLVDSERPMFSSLALTPDGADDGFLTVLEVFRMKCPADLVVLSACETGKGKVYKAEGIVGLTRAFMVAGAPRVLVSLWKVDDESTAALMTKFHESFKAGVPAAKALRDAQSFVKSQDKWKHPRFWAAWVLWGLPE
jgi:CHAT domain-containing protein